MADVKFCGMTRAADVEVAINLGVEYVGVVFAESPRRVTPSEARAVLRAARGSGVRCVGVFGSHSPSEILDVVDRVGLDCLQLHGPGDSGARRAFGQAFSGEVWVVARVGAEAHGVAGDLSLDDVDGVVLDTWSARALGGTGETFDWSGAAGEAARLRARTRLIVAGGLTADNVGRAIEILSPDVVDVSSGVERAPGIKDAGKMREFIDAVRLATTR